MALLRRLAVRVTAGLALAGGLVWAVQRVLRQVEAAQDRARNGVERQPPYPVAPEVRALHDRLTVADLHVDSLLWGRDLLDRHDAGHVDLPRLVEAGVAVVVFDAVTQVPMGLNFQRNSASRDLITLLSLANRRPAATLTSRLARALDTAARLREAAERSAGGLRLITTATELDALLADRETDPTMVGALLGIEGSHALDDRLESVDVLATAGFRIIGLQHFFDNRAGGSAHGESHGGLTDWGRHLVRSLQDRRMIVDLAHSSPAVVDDVLAISAAPLLVSHTGLRGVCDNERNLSDDQARAVAAGGGLIGVAMFEHAVGPGGVAATARSMRYLADLVGVAHVALGSDFDGAITTSVDVTGLPLLTGELLAQGFTQSEVAAIMGGNAVRFLRGALPA